MPLCRGLQQNNSKSGIRSPRPLTSRKIGKRNSAISIGGQGLRSISRKLLTSISLPGKIKSGQRDLINWLAFTVS